MEQLATLCGIRLRTGCFCNPGACAAAMGLTAEAMAANYEGGHVCWDDNDVIDGARYCEFNSLFAHSLNVKPSTFKRQQFGRPAYAELHRAARRNATRPTSSQLRA